MSPNELEFDKVYADWQAKIERYLVRLVGEDHAEDLAQETFVKVSHSLNSFRGEAKLSTWIYRIATNAAIDKLRSASFRRMDMETVLVESEHSEDQGREIVLQDKLLLPEQQVVREQMNDCIRDFIARLPEDYRTVLVLRELEGFKGGDVAEILGVSIGAVKIRLHRARAKLRAELIEHCDPYWIEENEFVPNLSQALRGYRSDT